MTYLIAAFVALSVLLFSIFWHTHRTQSAWQVARQRRTEPEKTTLEQSVWAAGLKTDNMQTVAIGVMAAAGGALAVYGVTGLLHLAPLGILAGLAAPKLWLNRLIKGRAQAFESGFQTSLSHMAASLRAGQNIDQALEQAAVAAEGPTREVLGMVVHLRRSGDSIPVALEKAGELVKSTSLDMMTVATSLHAQTGGDLADVYDQIADSIRDREAFHSQVQSATSESKMTGNILVVIPFAFVGMLRVLSPEYMAPLFAPQGLMIMAVCSAMIAVGYVILLRIAEVEY